ncbi:uncharacterized protein LOC120669437 [Panicum virgatum]|uniref:uncharacterized protein LOC120669437 n=1 Tax=Panicum virgatum TaxID=38727 RepID=UPI0019D52BE2|nr:uncharacterized protein LOC120669437 [Panicum virgatum]
MGVKYPDREEPKKPEKRSKGTSGEDPAAKKRKVSSADADASKADPKVLTAKLPRPPPKAPSTKKGPDSVGDVVVKLYPSRGAGLRSVSLLDLDDEGTAINPVSSMPAANVEPTPAPAKDAAKATGMVAATPSAQPSGALEGVETEGAGRIVTEAPKDPGPDVDPYLPWICEVDVATMIAELSHEIEFGPTKVPLPSQGTSSAVEKRQLEKELFDVEGFKNELESFGTGDLGRVVAAMNAKAFLAGRVLLKRVKMESDKVLEGSAERLRLVEENERMKKELSLLQALDDSRKKQNEELEERARRHDTVVNEMQKDLDSKEATIEGLRQEIVQSVDKAKTAESLAVQLSGDCAKKDKIIERLEEEARENTQLLAEATNEIVEKSSEIYEAYKDALATFGAEPEPLVRSDGLGLNGLLDWMLKEFAVLGNILTDISDNSAVISCENAFALLEHEGCQDLSKIAAPGYQLPKSSELETCSSRIQAVKKSFLRKFCLSVGRQALRDIACQRLEESKGAREAAKGVVDEGLEAGEIAGMSGQAGHDDEEEGNAKV